MTKKLVPDPPSSLLAFESRLAHVSDLLRWANATAYECGDNLHGNQRDLVMASAHMIAQAQTVVGQMLDHLPLMVLEEGKPESMDA